MVSSDAFIVPGPRRTIAVVEADDALRGALAFMLEAEGYAVLAYRRAADLQAELLDDRGDLVADALVVSDRPPGAGGQLLTGLRASGRAIPMVLLADPETVEAGAAPRGVAVVETPLVTDALRRQLRALLAPGGR